MPERGPEPGAGATVISAAIFGASGRPDLVVEMCVDGIHHHHSAILIGVDCYSPTTVLCGSCRNVDVDVLKGARRSWRLDRQRRRIAPSHPGGHGHGRRDRDDAPGSVDTLCERDLARRPHQHAARGAVNVPRQP